MEMSMEKKKLLTVSVSVGIVLIIIIAVVLILLPKEGMSRTAYAPSKPMPVGVIEDRPAPAEADPVGMIRNDDGLHNLQPFAEAGESETDFYIDGSQYATQIPQGNPAVNPAPGFTFTVPKPSAPGGSQSPAPRVIPPQSPRQNQPPKPETSAARKPAASSSSPAPSTAAVPDRKSAPPPSVSSDVNPAPARPPVSSQLPSQAGPQQTAPQPAHQYYNDFWVQTGAFSTKVRAEGAKETLSQKGITSIIENREIDGKLWYRVRVGPYTSENEANYWLALVKSIDGFAESQVRQSRSLR